MSVQFHRGWICVLATMLLAAPALQAQILSQFDIPPQSLAASLRAVGSQTSTNVLFDPPLVEGRKAPALRAQLTIDQALVRLLDGTGLKHRFLDDKTVMVVSAVDSQAAIGAQSGQHVPVAKADGNSPIRLAQNERDPNSSNTSETAAAGDEDDSSRDSSKLEEIIVTAQKREERLSDVPISITALTPEEMDIRGIRDISDIAASTPGLYFDPGTGQGNAITIRGVTSSGTGAGTTAIYLDDIPIQVRSSDPTFNTTTPRVFDLERVEVLRGPQGTLFGSSAQGGAVRFITPQPSLTDYSMYARSELADTTGGALSYEAGLAGGGPIIPDKLGFRASGWYRRAGGYVDHFSALPGGVNESNSDRSDSYVGRVALAFAPIDNLTFTASVFAQDVKTNDQSLYHAEASDPDNDRFVNTELLRQPNRDKFYVPSLKVEADFGPVTLTSISTFLHREYSHRYDATNLLPARLGIPLPTSAAEFDDNPMSTEQDNFAQELRLSSADPEARLQWTVGAYYAEAKQDGLLTLIAPAFPQQILDGFGVTIEELFGAGLVDGQYSLILGQHNRDEQVAGFTNLEYELFSGFSVAAGVRVSSAKYTSRTDRDGALFGGPSTDGGKGKDNSVTPKFGINYRPNSDHLFYVSAAQGFREGGVNPPAVTLNTDACRAQLAEVGLSPSGDQSYESDSLWSYEVGSKNALLDGRLRVSASVFHLDWKDIQRTLFLTDCLTLLIANLDDATSDGFDVAVDAKLTDRLIFNLAAGYTSAKYTADSVASGNFLARDGEQISDVPPWSITAALEYHFAISAAVPGYVRAENRYSSKNDGRFPQQNPDNGTFNPGFFVRDSKNELNLRAGGTWGKFDVSVFVNNALNEQSLLYTQPLFTGIRGDMTIRPRTIGLTGIYRW